MKNQKVRFLVIVSILMVMVGCVAFSLKAQNLPAHGSNGAGSADIATAPESPKVNVKITSDERVDVLQYFVALQQKQLEIQQKQLELAKLSSELNSASVAHQAKVKAIEEAHAKECPGCVLQNDWTLKKPEAPATPATAAGH